jgi:hypothetical protein
MGSPKNWHNAVLRSSGTFCTPLQILKINLFSIIAKVFFIAEGNYGVEKTQSPPERFFRPWNAKRFSYVIGYPQAVAL